MTFSISDILRDLGASEHIEAPAPVLESVKSSQNVETELDPQKIATYLEYLATPDSVIDELAKLAVLQDFISQNNISMDKVASLSLEIRDVQKEGMLKQASALLNKQTQEIKELQEQIILRSEAEKIATKLHLAGNIDAENILDKVAELVTQGRDELRTLDRAIDLTKGSKNINLGDLSSRSDISDNPFLDYILS